MIYLICNCPKNINIPVNDFQAYRYYKDLRYIYNKKWIADSQNLKCGFNKELPNKFPVISRPIVNLHGMGKGTQFVNGIFEFKNIQVNHFWEEIIKGNHYSVDIFRNDYGILGWICFKGFPTKGFMFNYWEYLPEYELPNNIKRWINTYLSKYKGVFNMELIGDKIIECHLRMGDMNYFQNEEIIKKLIMCHLNKYVKLPKLNKIYLVPVFVKKGCYKKLKKEDIYFCARKYGIDRVLNYIIDPSPKYIGNPSGGDRVCNLTVFDLDLGLKIRNCLLNYLK